MLFSVVQYFKYLVQINFRKDESDIFLSDFKKNVLKKKAKVTNSKEIAELAAIYRSKNFVIPKEDYGAGSKKSSKKNHLYSAQLLKEVSISKKNGTLLHHLVSHYKLDICIELGTSLGMSTAYLSNNTNTVISIEGNKELASISHKMLKNAGIKNIKLINGNFDDVLENIFKENLTFDLLFIDGNHTEEATLAYFEMALKYLSEKSIIVFDDINWSIGMKNAWCTIIKHTEVEVSIDLFRQGIVFFDKSIQKKEHYKLWH
jgi:predicted O-methyltransferase YrrM